MSKAALKTKARPLLEKLRSIRGGKKLAPAPRLTKKELEALKQRDALIAEYMPYAASIASRVYQSLSSVVEYEEVLCTARMGLLEAAKRFDETQEVDFKTFAYYRIKGAIYDGLRKAGWIPRALYAKIKFEEAANEYLKHMSQYADSRGADHGDEAVTETVNSLASIYIISLDANEDMEIEDKDGPDIEKNTEFLQVRQHMRDAIDSLPAVEKRLIKMYYFQNRTLEEIGERLNLSKSWTSRLHARALSMLLKRIRNRTHTPDDGVEMQEGEEI